MTQAQRIELGFRRVVQLMKGLIGQLSTVTEIQSYTGTSTERNTSDGRRYVLTTSSATVDGVTVLSASGQSTKRWLLDSHTINVKWFGAKGDGVTNDAPAIQAAIDYASTKNSPFKPRKVFLPKGDYVITSTLNLINTRQNNTLARDGLIVEGESSTGTQIIGRTGAYAMMELTGSQLLELRNLRLSSYSTDTNPSVVGVYTGLLTVLPQTQNQIYSNLVIMLHDNAAANGGLGTVAFWCFGAEENTHDHVYYSANRAMIITGYRNNPGVYNSPFHAQTDLEPSHSIGVTTMTGECFVQTIGGGKPIIETVDVNSFHAPSLYMNGPLTGTYSTAFVIQGLLSNSTIGGTLEGYAQIAHIRGTLDGCKLNFVLGGNNTSQAFPVISLEQTQGWIRQCDITIEAVNNGNRQLFAVKKSDGTDLANSELATCHVRNTTVKSNFSLTYSQLPPKVLWNPNTQGVVIHSSDSPAYYIDTANQHRIAIPRKMIRDFGATPAISSAGVIRVQLPPVVTNLSGQAMVVSLDGTAAMDFRGSNGIAVRYLKSDTSIITAYSNGAISNNTDQMLGSQLSSNASASSIEDITVSVTNSGTSYADVVLTPTISGVSNEAVFFYGTAKLMFSGHVSDAPYLKII